MKHVKTYESIEPKMFWTVENDDNFSASLYKIGMPIKDVLVFNTLKERSGYDKRFFIGATFARKSDIWTYIEYNYTSGNNRFTELGYKFMGFVEPTDKDVEKYEHDLEIYKLQRDDAIGKYNI